MYETDEARMSTLPIDVNSSISSRHWCLSSGLFCGSSRVLTLISWLKNRLMIRRLSASLFGWMPM